MTLKLLLSLLFVLTLQADAATGDGDSKAPASTAPSASLLEFKAKLLAATTRHLNLLISSDSVGTLKGKTSAGQEAFAFYPMFELTGDQRFRGAAIDLANRILKDM